MPAKSAGNGNLDHLGPRRTTSGLPNNSLYFPVATVSIDTHAFVIGRVIKQVDELLQVILIGDGVGSILYSRPKNFEKMVFISVRQDGSINWRSESEAPLPAEIAIENIKAHSAFERLKMKD